MVTFRVPEQELELPRNIGLLDTNVLVAFVDNRDAWHELSVLLIEENEDYEWSVNLPVVVEACGLLGARCGQTQVLTLLRWLLTPGNVWLLPGSHPSLSPTKMLLITLLGWINLWLTTSTHT